MPAIRRIFLSVLALSVFCLAPGPAPAKMTRPLHGQALTILHTSDVHSRLLPVNRAGQSCMDPAASGDCLGGAARMATVVAQVRRERPNDTVLLLDAGDRFQGSLFFTLFKGLAEQAVMNAAGYDAMTLGNHEFDEGTGTLGTFLGGTDFPVLACNLDPAQPALAGQVFPYAVMDMGGTPVGVIGALTPETTFLSKGAVHVGIAPVAPAVARAVAELEAQGVQVIILLSHQGITPDLALAAFLDGLDVIVSGHSHTLLSNDDPAAYGPCPMVIETPSGAPCLVVATGEWGTHLGELSVRFDEAGRPWIWSGRAVLLDASVAPDPAMDALVRGMASGMDSYMHHVVARTAGPVPGQDCRHGECAMGDVAAEALLEAGRTAGATVGLLNAGAVRAGLPQGEVTMSDLLTALPFGGDVVTTTLSGADLLEVLEHGLSRAGGETEGTGRFLQVAGARLAWNPEAQAGHRLVRAEVRGADGNWAPVDQGTSYVVATNAYMAAGGDDFQALARNAATRYHTGLTVTQAVRGYLGDHWELAVELDGRISQE